MAVAFAFVYLLLTAEAVHSWWWLRQETGRALPFPWSIVTISVVGYTVLVALQFWALRRERNVSVQLHGRGLIVTDWRGRRTRIGWPRVRDACLARGGVLLVGYAWLDCVDGPLILDRELADPASLVVAVNDRLAELRGLPSPASSLRSESTSPAARAR